jgi:uncharacterized protein (DUF58 family)
VTSLATARLSSYPWLVAGLLVAALATGRPELAVVAAPLTVLLLVGLWASRRPGRPRVHVTASADRILEGDSLELRADVTVPAEVEALEVGVALPAGLELEGSSNPMVARRTPDGQSQTLVFTVRSGHWGVFRLGDLHLRGFDDFHLRRFQGQLRFGLTVRVYPRPERLRSLMRPRTTHVHAGNRVSLQKGEGIQFADVRPFVSGDRPRSVNWRASARRGSLWVNQRHPERNVDVVLLIDTFTHVGRPGAGTLEQMVRGAASLAAAWLRDRDRVGVIGFGGVLRWLEVGGGLRHAYRLVDSLIDTQVVFSYARKEIGVIPVRMLPPHALIVGLSPLLDARVVTALLDLCGRGFDLAVIEMAAEPLLSPPESELESVALRLWRLRREALRSTFTRAGVAVGRWVPGEPLETVVAELEAWRRRALLRAR